jgi:polyphosphate kinase
LFTAKAAIAEDVTNLFNLLTGICQFQGTSKLVVAPFELKKRVLALIDRECQNAARGLPARIVAKMNSLVDPEIITALYQASQAGVRIELIVRGVCCLAPGVKGVSDHITVRSIIDRFLEHSRIFYFENGCQPEIYIGSADWMPRNLVRRIEVLVPIEDGNLRERIASEILATQLADNVKAKVLREDGSYEPAEAKRGAPARRSQMEFVALAQGTPKAARKARPGPKFAYPAVKLRAKPEES